MKHNLKITAILLGMFLITQFIGLFVIYSNPLVIKQEINGTITEVPNPALSWINPPEPKSNSEFNSYLGSIIFSFILAVVILLLLTKFKIEFVLKTWFFLVVALALFIFFIAVLPEFQYSTLIAFFLAVPLAFIKIYKRNFIIHNLTELFIYPGIAVVFVPILNFWTIIVLLILISGYDIWAVWHSGIMQKMAKYQINKLKIFSGFFIPYVSKELRMKLKKMKKSDLKKKNIKVGVAILGGGDVVFPIITSGVILKYFGLIPALFIILGATLGLVYLLIFSEKKKFYPAMPFITLGMLVCLGIYYLIF